jgi:DNA-binding response OmpR family regulator
MTIGVLDDDPTICRFLATALELAGHKVYTYTDPQDFLSVYPDRTDYFNCIIVDFRLPGTSSGAEIIRQVKIDRPSLPAILISADALPQTMLQGLSDTAIFQKPFQFSKLLGMIDILDVD